MTNPVVLSYGELGVDNIIQVPHLPSPEEAAFPVADSYHIGGAAANFAVWLAAWDTPVALTGNLIGDDDLGQQLLTWLSEYPQLDRSWLEIADQGETPFCRILVTPDGERTILVFGYPQAEVVPLTEPMLKGIRYISIDLYGGDERTEAARVARRAGVVTVVNDVIDPDHPILDSADIAVNSAAYIRAAQSGVEPVPLSERLAQAAGTIVVTTNGPEPIHVVNPGSQAFWVRPPHAEKVVDATGAGDAFRAGLVRGLLDQRNLDRSVQLGAAAGALKVARRGGGRHVPQWERVEQLAHLAQIDRDTVSATGGR